MKKIQATVKKRQKIKVKVFYVKKFFVKPRKMPRENDKVWMNPIIKDLIINKEEYAMEVKYGKQDSWGFQSAHDFFKEKNRQQKD